MKLELLWMQEEDFNLRSRIQGKRHCSGSWGRWDSRGAHGVCNESCNQDIQYGNSASHPLLYDGAFLRCDLAGESHVFILQEDGRSNPRYREVCLSSKVLSGVRQKSSWMEQNVVLLERGFPKPVHSPVFLVSHLVSCSN